MKSSRRSWIICGHGKVASPFAAITAAVNDQLGVLLKLAPLQAKLFDRARNRTHAKKLDRALSEVEMLLASVRARWRGFCLIPCRQ